MARDRKRAKQRRERQAKADGAQARRTQRAAVPPHDRPTHDEPAERASGDADLIDAHLALGRPELAEAGDAVAAEDAANGGAPDAFADEAEFEALEDRVDDAEERYEEESEGGAAVVTRTRRGRATVERSEGNRFANFLRGSWRELQRVQWPDRQQVGQATAVVIGFVIVAGAFLGLMDFFSAKIVDFIV